MSFMEKIKVGIEKGLEDERMRTAHYPNYENATLRYLQSLSIQDQSAVSRNDTYLEKDCYTLLQDLVNYFLIYNRTMMQIFRNSGKDYNDFGRFYECRESEEFNYILAYLSPPTQFTNPIAVGMCIPQACKVEDLNAFKQYIIPAVNSIMPFMFEGIYDLGL